MDFNFNWQFLAGIFLVGVGPLFVIRRKLKLNFDSEIFQVSDIVNVFVSISCICIYISLGSYGSGRNQSDFSIMPSSYLFLCVLSGFYIF